MEDITDADYVHKKNCKNVVIKKKNWENIMICMFKGIHYFRRYI